jgi:hypothetical protein
MNSTNNQNQQTQSQKRYDFCKELGNLLNVYIFNEEITSQITLDASKSAEQIKKSYDELADENRMLKIQLANIQQQANRITNNSYYHKHIKLDTEKERKNTHLSVIEKAQSEQYICCDICDRFVRKNNKQHYLTDICLSIRVSKELSHKSNKYILHKKKKKDVIVAFRNFFIMNYQYVKLKMKKEKFQDRINEMNDKLAPLLKRG